MRVIHTSDWHIGRSFHAHSTLDHLETVLDAIGETTEAKQADVVIVAGDVFDSATPSADSLRLFTSVLRRLRATGAQIVVTSGNHDAPARLGFQSEFLPFAGIHIVTDPTQHAVPIVIDDEHGPVHFYGVPFLEPSLVRHHWPETKLRTQEQVMTFALENVRASLAATPARSVAIAHCFAASVPASDAASDVEREIRVGSLDVVPLEAFEGIDYVALGHIHGRAMLAPGIRYSGAPLHYGFGEAGKPRGVWVVDLDDAGLQSVEWAALPVPRSLRVIVGTLEHLLTSEDFTEYENDWVKATLTDQTRPIDAMRKLQARFPWCATLDHQPENEHDDGKATYAARVTAARNDLDLIDGFLGHVRNGVQADDAERGLLEDIVAAHARIEVAA